MNQLMPSTQNNYSTNAQNWNSYISYGIQYGPNPNHPAYVFGREVLLPTIDASVSICRGIFTKGYAMGMAIEELFRRIINIIPGAQANPNVDRAPLSQQGCSVNPNQPQQAKVPQGRSQTNPNMPLSQQGQALDPNQPQHAKVPQGKANPNVVVVPQNQQQK